MRVAIVHATLPEPGRKPGGVDVHVHRLADQLALAGEDVTVFSTSQRPSGASYRWAPLAGGRVWRMGTLGRLALAPWTLNLLPISRFDVIHLHGDDWFFLRRSVPTVRTFHGTGLEEARHADSRRVRWLYTAVFMLELWAARLASQSYGVSPAGPLSLRAHGCLPCGVEATPNAPHEGRRQEGAILFVGTWEGRKQGAALWRVFREHIAPAHPEAELWMVSDYCDDAPGVRWFPNPGEDELSDLYSRAAVFCSPSAYEGLGIPYLEAIAHGLPVVAVANPGSRFVLADGRYGVLTDLQNLPGALAHLLNDSARRGELSVAGRARARDFSWEKTVAAHRRAYRGAVRGRDHVSLGKANG